MKTYNLIVGQWFWLGILYLDLVILSVWCMYDDNGITYVTCVN